MATYTPTGNVSTVGAINAELEKVEEAIDSCLDKNGDTLLGDIDLNSQRLYNAPTPLTATDVARLRDVALLVSSLSVASRTIERTGRGINIVAHRGWRDCFPQNTMLAFSSALRRGAQSLECDLQVTSDGVVVVYHDDTLNSLTDGSGSIASNNLATVQSATIDETAGTVFSETRIPQFSQLLRYASRNDVDIWPEVKKYRTQDDISLMVADVVSFGMEDRCVMASFSLSDVQRVRQENDNIGVGLLGASTVEATYQAAVDSVADLGGRGYIIWDNQALLTVPDIITYAFSKGVDVATYTVDNNTTAKALVGLGVKDIITDIPLVTK